MTATTFCVLKACTVKESLSESISTNVIASHVPQDLPFIPSFVVCFIFTRQSNLMVDVRSANP